MAGIRDFLLTFLRKKPVFAASLSPEQRFVAIGDIHGRHDLLVQLLKEIDAVAPDVPKVFVGDYLDRGPDSASVLQLVMNLSSATPEKVICLKGNHEAMLLDFLDAPIQAGPQWLRNGGEKTLESFGIPAPFDDKDEPVLYTVRDALEGKIGPKMIAWMRALPLVWQSGNIVVSHAGGDPMQTIEPRRGHGLLWGHPDFLRKPRNDGLWMVHGHYITDEANAVAGRIALDTGAYATGKLSAAIIEPDGARFLHT